MTNEKQKSIIAVLYIFMIVSTVLSFAPNMMAQTLSLPLMLVTLAAAYYYKSRSSEEDLLQNHMVYMVGTIWIGSTFLLLGMMAAGYIVFKYGDHSPVQATMDSIMGGGDLNAGSLQDLMMEYMSTNKVLLIKASLPTIGPAILYFVYRIVNGYGRAAKGYRIAKPKSWL
jgi:uncharacterized membrane protein